MTEQTNVSYREKLAHYLIILITLGIAAAICWFLRDVLVYLLLAALVSLLAAPLAKWLGKIKIRNRVCPDWLVALLSMLILFIVMSGIIMLIVPLVVSVSGDISAANINDIAAAASVPLNNINIWIRSTFHSVGPDFKIESLILENLQNIFDMSTVSSILGSLTSFITNLGITVFSVAFISFFFIKQPDLVANLFVRFIPDQHIDKVKSTVLNIKNLVSRYFVGVSIEVLGVSLLNFIGLLAIAKMGVRYSLGIAFMTGVLNIIPYIGPFLGIVLGTSLSLVIKYICATSYGLAVSFPAFILILVGIFVFTQLVDNYVYQPVIYSNSVKIHPLEIFIVFLIAGEIGGMAGMFAAIPAYTVLKEIARQLLPYSKLIRRLTSSKDAS